LSFAHHVHGDFIVGLLLHDLVVENK
jgi:hypothetical protein